MSNIEKAKELEIEAINYRQNKCFFPVTMTYDQIMECAKQVELGYRAGYQLGQSQQPDIKQWVSEQGEQAFEHYPNLAEQLQYAACHWKVDMSTWSELLQEINKICEIALSK